MIRLMPEKAGLLLTYLRTLLDGKEDVPSVIDEILNSINDQIQNPAHSYDLVEKIAKLFSNRSVISGRLMQDIRQNILTPSEFAKIKGLEDVSSGCVMCGAPINEGDLATVYDRRLACSKCLIPSSVTCKDCDRPLELPGVGRIVNRVRKTCQCQTTAAAQPQVNVAGAATPIATRENRGTDFAVTRDRLLRTARMQENREAWVVAATQPPPPPVNTDFWLNTTRILQTNDRGTEAQPRVTIETTTDENF